MKRISKEAEVIVFREFQSGDEKAFTKIHQQFKPLAISRVNNLVASKDCEHLRDELESAAYESLWNAAKTFDLERGCSFTTYATRCIDRAMRRQVRKYHEEKQYIKEYSHETFEVVVDSNSDDCYEILVNDPFPCHDEPILSELTPFCEPEELAILGLICTNEDVWHKSGNLNNAAIARKLGISRERVRQILVKPRTNKLLESTIRELVSH